MPAVPHYPAARPNPGAAEAGFLGSDPASGFPSPATANQGQRKAPTPNSPSGSPSPNNRSTTAQPRPTRAAQTSPTSPDLPNFPIASPNNPHPNPFNPNILPTQIPKWGKNENIPIQPIPRSPKQPLNHCSATANARSANLPPTTAQPLPTRAAQTSPQQLPSKDPHSSACFSLLPRGDTRNPPVP